MRKLVIIGLLMILVGLVIIRWDDLVTLFNTKFQNNSIQVTLGDKNGYYRDYDFLLVQNTDNFAPHNRQDVLNIYYTAINAGKATFSFYCPKDYNECLTEVQNLANDQTLLSDINNYVHPFNGFAHIETKYDSLGKVTISIIHSYNREQRQKITEQVDLLYKSLVNENLSIEDNIRNIHDYIINHTKYDSLRSDQNVLDYHSDIAYGPLFEGYAVCGGYTDLMELFLEKMQIKSFKVSSDDHVWNAVNIGDKWLHIDLTWDDPVADDGNNYLEHNYFLIDTPTLLAQEQTQHIFNQKVYQEVAS